MATGTQSPAAAVKPGVDQPTHDVVQLATWFGSAFSPQEPPEEPPEEPPPRPPPPPRTLNDIRVGIASSLHWSYWVLVFVIPLLLAFMLSILGGVFGAKATIDRLALVSSLQVGLGMFLGFMSLYFGVMMTWIGIESAFNFAGSGRVQTNEAAVTLSSAGPGLFFGLIGAVLISTSLYKTIEFAETRPVEEVSSAGQEEKKPAHKRLSNQTPSAVITLTPEEQKGLPSVPDESTKGSVPMPMR